MNEVENQNQDISKKRAFTRMEIIKKRKDFNQAYKFYDAEILKPQIFAPFKDDNLGYIKNSVMEIGYIFL